MTRHLKFIEGDPIQSMSELAQQIEAGNYVIHARTKQRIHPSWVASWQLNMAMSYVRQRLLLRAVPNPHRRESTTFPAKLKSLRAEGRQ